MSRQGRPGTLRGPASVPVLLLQRLLLRLWPQRARSVSLALPASPGHSQAVPGQQDLLSELQLLQLGHSLQQQAQKSGRYDGPAAEALLGIADALELHHGWDPLLVEAC
ncbi:hypothetical protein IFHNHDMJ_02897 [Synechococcus sp. CBW1107]|nr:hypothetical protein IFHNHDMJ_02897 [Synechococcus sp. CBW1107]